MDDWMTQHEAAASLAADVAAMVQERNTKHPSGPNASRLTAEARRKLGSLTSALDGLRDAAEAAAIPEAERNRRRDLVAGLRSRREALMAALRRGSGSGAGGGPGGAARAALLEPGGGGAGPGPAARETAETAGLDTAGLLDLQRQTLARQDVELEGLERTVASTKHIALAVNEELDLQSRLLDDFGDDLDATVGRLAAARRRLALVAAQAGECRTTLTALGAMLALSAVAVLLIRLARLL